jgi:hypothetical protein
MDVAGLLLILRMIIDLIHKNVPQGSTALGRAWPQLVAGVLSAITVFAGGLHPFHVPTGSFQAGGFGQGVLDSAALWMATMGADNVLKSAQKTGGD